MKLNREALMTYLDAGMHTTWASVTAESPVNWEIIGDDIEEMSVEMNSETEQHKNILGQTRTDDKGYSPTMDADPFYADPEKALYTVLRDIAMERKKGDQCKTLMMEVIVEDTEATTHAAYVREVILKPTSYGGDTTYVNIPFNVSEDGGWIKGTVTAASLRTGSPVFTPTP